MELLRSSALYGFLKPLTKFVEEHRYVALCGSAALGLALYQIHRSRGLPPGPWGWPVIGSSRLVTSGHFEETLTDLHKKYGNMVCLWLGGNTYWVILNGYDIVKEAYIDRGYEFMDRKMPPIWDYLDIHDNLFTSPVNETYKANRKFCTVALRSAGFAKDRLDELLAREWELLAEVFDNCQTTGIDQEKYFQWALTNVISSVLYSKHLQYGDEELDDMGNALLNSFETLVAADSAYYIPEWLSSILGSAKRAKARAATEKITELISKHVLNHQNTYDANNIRDFVDTCLKHGILDKMGIRYTAHLCLMFSADAVFTTNTVLMCVIIYLIHYPSYQQRMREEFNDVINANGGAFSLTLKDKTPFTEAFLNEVLRMSTPFLTTAVNRPAQTTTFRNYRIPKHFNMLVNLAGLHSDPVVFPEPKKFNPERFLQNGKLKRMEQFNPFGIGPRRCMGETLARSEIFYFTASLLLRYEISGVAGQLPDPSLIETGTTKTHPPFNAVFKKIE